MRLLFRNSNFQRLLLSVSEHRCSDSDIAAELVAPRLFAFYHLALAGAMLL
jgi:hypothetical protein